MGAGGADAFGMEPAFTYHARVSHLVDGDTLDVVVDLGFRASIEVRLRLYGIDTPEQGQPGHDEASAALAALAPVGAQVVVRTSKSPEKYGRWVAVLALADGRVANDLLLAQGLAKAYFGGSKAAERA